MDGVHPAGLAEESLIRQCDMGFGRTSGPGGQHRNKVETAVSLVHRPTGVQAAAGERRKQYDNRREAIWRLRIKLAMNVRTRVNRDRVKLSDLWKQRRQGKQMSVNPLLCT